MKSHLSVFILLAANAMAAAVAPTQIKYEYTVLATKKTSTMEQEIQSGAAAGMRVEAVVRGDTLAGKEVLAILSRPVGAAHEPRYAYKLLTAKKTGTIQKELQEAAAEGFLFRDLVVFSSTFGGKETIVLMEKDLASKTAKYEVKVIGAKLIGNMRKDVTDAAAEGYHVEAILDDEGDSAGLFDLNLSSSQTVAVLSRPTGVSKPRYAYNLLDAMSDGDSDGYRFKGLTHGFKGRVYVMEKDLAEPAGKLSYRFLSVFRPNKRLETLDRNQAEGYVAINVFEDGMIPTFIVEKDASRPVPKSEYRILHTLRTGTLEKDLSEAAAEGFIFRGVAANQTLDMLLARPMAE